MREREPLSIVILQESQHFVIVRPPRMDTRKSEILEDLEFLLSKGFRPLSFTTMNGHDAIVCQKMAGDIMPGEGAGPIGPPT